MHTRAIRWFTFLFVCVLIQGGPRAQQRARPTDHVIVVMLDGARPDALRLARTPTLDRLAASGARYMQARTVYPSQTRVAFVSLPTGAHGGSHGIIGGDAYKDAAWQTVTLGTAPDPLPAQALVQRRTIFEEAASAGLTSLYAAMKGYELVGARGATWTINGHLTIDRTVYAAGYETAVGGSTELAVGYKHLMSRQLLDQVLQVFRKERPNVVVMNLGSADYTGHTFGPETPQYRQTLEFLDSLIGDLLRTLDEMQLRERTTVIVSADHGFSHGDGQTLAAPPSSGAPQVAALTALGIEHYVSNTGGTSMGVYLRDKQRVAAAAAAIRREPWTQALYCEEPSASCDRTLRELRAFFPGRSPDLMVDLDDEATVNRAVTGNHGSLRHNDMQIPLILSGAGVAPGFIGGTAELVDVAPTIARLLGLTPHLMQPDGRVLEEALVPARD